MVAASVPVLDVAEAQVEADGLSQQRQQRSLLQLVVQDGCVTLTPACAHIGFRSLLKSRCRQTTLERHASGQECCCAILDSVAFVAMQ